MNPIEQQFFNDLEKKLWTAADKLRSNLDAAVYKHVVLGLIFLKYVSDAFEERQRELLEQFQNPDHDYYLAPEDYGEDYESHLAAELEIRDYYTEKNVFWVPIEARWRTLCDCAQLPPKAALPWNKPGKGEPEAMRSVGWLIDNAMDAIERENEKKLKNVLNKDFARTACLHGGPVLFHQQRHAASTGTPHLRGWLSLPFTRPHGTSAKSRHAGTGPNRRRPLARLPPGAAEAAEDLLAQHPDWGAGRRALALCERGVFTGVSTLHRWLLSRPR